MSVTQPLGKKKVKKASRILKHRKEQQLVTNNPS